MTTPARIAVIAAIVAAIVALGLLLPIGDWAMSAVAWIRGAGAAGALVFFAAYVLATVLLLPGSVLTLGAGFAYGPVWGTLLVSPTSVVAALVAFALGRTALRGRVERRVARDSRFAAIDRGVADEGFKITLLLRLSPLVPYNLLNYALGVTSIRTATYVLASALGMLPGTILYVYLGSLATSAAQLAAGETPDAGPWRTALYWGGLACTILATWIVTRIARRALRRNLEARP